jgi:hypothetical protein
VPADTASWRGPLGGREGDHEERLADHGGAATARAEGEVDSGEALQEVSPVVLRAVRFVRRNRCVSRRYARGGGCEQRASALERAASLGRGEESGVPDLDEATGQDVEEEAADEFARPQRDLLFTLGCEAHGVGVDRAQAAVGEADAVGVAAEVAETCPAPPKGRLA